MISSLLLAGKTNQLLTRSSTDNQPLVYIFSKHLQFLSYQDMASISADLGFDGIDLTVRPGGHVIPDDYKNTLPKAIVAIKNEGLKANIITTIIDDTSSETEEFLNFAAGYGVEYYRMNWLKYDQLPALKENWPKLKQLLTELSKLSKDLSITGCYQNHAGNMVGASLYELDHLMTDIETENFGIEYDIRHAVVEGGLSWLNGLYLAAPHIKLQVWKDFLWVKQNGEWKIENVPLGEGMVDFKKYVKALKQLKINTPIILHAEYDLGGAEHGDSTISVTKDVVLEALAKDLSFIKKLWT